VPNRLRFIADGVNGFAHVVPTRPWRGGVSDYNIAHTLVVNLSLYNDASMRLFSTTYYNYDGS
jgi:hypothetical protein